MYFLLNMGIFQPAMLGTTRGYINICRISDLKKADFNPAGPKPWARSRTFKVSVNLLASVYWLLNSMNSWTGSRKRLFFFAKKVVFFFWSLKRQFHQTQGGGFNFFFGFPDFCIFFLEGLKPPTSVDILSTDTLNVRLMYETLHCLQGLFWSRRKYMG